MAFIGRWGSGAILLYDGEVTVLNAAFTMPRDTAGIKTADPEPPPEVARAEREDALDEERLEEILGALESETERLEN